VFDVTSGELSAITALDGSFMAAAAKDFVHPALGDDPSVNTWILYEHRLRRTGDGWKIIYTRLVPLHSVGNSNLLADVAEGSR
jgi:hypothetical protein